MFAGALIRLQIPEADRNSLASIEEVGTTGQQLMQPGLDSNSTLDKLYLQAQLAEPALNAVALEIADRVGRLVSVRT